MTDLVRTPLGADLAVDLATELATLVAVDDPRLLGLTNLSAANYYATLSGGGEAGVATGFVIAVLFQGRLAGTTDTLVHRLNDSNTAGWMLRIDAAGNFSFFAVDTALRGASLGKLLGSDVGRLHLGVGVVDANSNLLRGYSGRAEYGTGAFTAASYAPLNGAQFLGRRGGDNSFAVSNILATAAFRGVPTLAQIQDYYDRARALGDLPDTIQGATVTHHWSARRALLGKAPASGQAAPATLADNITGAAADVMAKQGAPTVVVIDPSIDGRKTYGAQGLSAATGLQTSGVGGIAGVGTGFHLVIPFVAYVGSSANRFLAFRLSGSAGWSVDINAAGTTLRVVMYSSAPAAVIINVTLLAADLGRPRLCEIVHTGSAINVYLDGALVSGPTAIVGFTAAAVPTAIGLAASDNLSVFGLSGGHAVHSAGDVAAGYATWLATGRLQAGPGTEHLWDITADVLASGQEAVPAIVLDRIGTDHLTRVGPDYAIGAVRGLRLLSVGAFPTNGLLTVSGGGIAGATSAVTVSVLCSVLSVIVAAGGLEMIASKYVSGGSGWDFRRTGTVGTLGNLAVAFGTPGGGNPSPPVYAVQAQDVGALLHLAFTYNGSAQSFYVNGTLIGSIAVSGTYGNPATPMLIGARSEGFGNQNTTLFVAIGGGAYVATQAELAAQATASIAAGQLVAIPGKTDQRRYNYAQDAIDQNTPLPAFCVDRMGNADPLVRLGSGLTLAQRVERVWSYETSPILYGANGLSLANHYSVAGGIPGHPAGFWVALAFRIDSQAVVSKAARMLLAKRTDNPNLGWQFYTTGMHNTLLGVICTTTTYYLTPVVSLTSSDVGKLLLATLVYDGQRVRMYIRRNEQGSGTATAGTYQVDSVPMRVGRSDSVSDFSADGYTAFGCAGGHAVPSLAEIQALHDAVMATEDIAAIPGKTDHIYSFKRDVFAAGGALPTTLLDRIGPDHMTKAGNPTLAPQYARAWGW